MRDPNQTVLKLLSEHQASDAKEVADVAMIETFARAHACIFGKANPLGHITGSALVLDIQGRLLLTFHAKLERWLQVGGHSDPHEFDPADTALREAEEESGLSDLIFHPAFGRVPMDIDVHRIPARKTEVAHDHLDFRYALLTERPEDIVCTKESKALRWVALHETTDLGFDPALCRAIAKVSRALNT